MSKTTIPTGGITDGTIASGDLADDAVTAAKIADAVGLGKVLQAQSSSSNSRTTISTSSKVLVIISAQFGMDSNNAAVTTALAKFQLTRNHSGISETEIFHTKEEHNRPENSGMDMIFHGNLSIIFLDSPSSTNELTYTLNALVDPDTGTLEMIAGGSNEHNKAITLIEIGA